MKKLFVTATLLTILAGISMAAPTTSTSGATSNWKPVPEPMTMLCLGAGALMLIRRRKKA